MIEGCVDQHETYDGIVESKGSDKLCNADEEDDRREHLAHDDEAQEDLLAFEAHA